MNMIDFYNPQHSRKILSLYKQQFLQDVNDVLGSNFSIQELSPEFIFVLYHKCQLQWLKDAFQTIDPQEDFHHDIFEVLTDSEYSQGFLELVQDPQVSFINAVDVTINYYEQQLGLIQTYHIEKQRDKISHAYQLNQDMGDYTDDSGNIIIGGIEKSIPDSSIILKDQTSSESQTQKRVNKTIQRLKKLTPECFERLQVFTQYLVPTFSSGMVSFSSESLPFYSCINFNERDDVDLLDDLLHENGHHQLNFFLYTYELMDESDPNLYFSPWRESLRPLRGIFHGFCTFFWALDLFYQLLNSKELENEFCEEDIAKIKWRFNEELLLLQMAFPCIEQAHQRGFVTNNGMFIAQSLMDKINDYKENHLCFELSKSQAKSFQVLSLKIEDKRQECEKSL